MIANKIKRFEKYNLNFKDSFSSICIIIIMFLIVSNPSHFSKGTVEGIKLFFFNVFPGLLPFMFLTKLLTEIGIVFKLSTKVDKISYKIFGTPGISFYALFMSIVSGYPIGAKIISDLYNKKMISSEDAKKMTIFCTTSGPIFVIGAVGNIMFGSQTIGIILYLSHIFSAIIMAITYNILTRKNAKHTQIYSKNCNFEPKCQNILAECVVQTIDSILIVGAYITIFYLLIEVLTSLKITHFLNVILKKLFDLLGTNSSLSNGTIFGLFEITRGCKELSSFKTIESISICAGLISFSGLSIIFQSMAFLKDAKIKMHNFILTKTVHLIVSCFLCKLILICFGATI